MELKRVGLPVMGERPEAKAVEMQELPADTPLDERVKAALRTIFDPELPVNIYELGLIYKVAVSPESDVAIEMTLTSPACPVAGSLVGEVQRKVAALPQVKSAKVDLVWDPPWDKSRMSEEAALELGLM